MANRSSLFWVHAVCFYTLFVSNVRQIFEADDFSRRHFQMRFFLGALRVNHFYGFFNVLLESTELYILMTLRNAAALLNVCIPLL